ncbi:Regulatory protein BlaR1 [Stieleria neptunia]|uniref:Regulatory protein BlaR1 n=1 Tax=Stieleria neptunia TaxID=2527979 RepID=A0A518HYU7_9BACT|nr:M56 family metallopeptidase [Stieleria neptunia]QDV45954.1 Regulatory protein BlaR1 [Stieleria neptunia]
MSEWLHRWDLIDQTHPALATLILWVLRAAMIVMAAWFMDRLASKWSSGFRHCVWICAFGALVLLVPQLLTSFPIRIPVRVLQSSASPVSLPTNDVAVTSDRQRAASSVTAERRRRETNGPISDAPVPAHSAAPPVPSIPVGDAVSPVSDAFSARPPEQRSVPVTAASSSVALIMIMIYFTGLLGWIVRIVVSWVRLRRFATEAIELTAEQWQLAQICARRLCLSGTPQCRISASVSLPLTFGVLRPMVLVPISFRSFTVDQQRHCLLHEMAHVARRDSCWNWLAEITSAVYWFHPSVHWARRNLRRSREDAADDAVLRSGESRASYSRSLLEITQGIAAVAQPPAAISSGTNLQYRIGRMLARTSKDSRPPRWTIAAVGLGFLLIALSGISLEAVVAQTSPAVVENNAVPLASPPQDRVAADEGLFQRFQTVELAKPAGEASQQVNLELVGRVTDANGPVLGAVVLIREFVFSRGPDGKYISPPIVARTTTGQDGRYQVQGFPTIRLKSLGRARWEILVADKTDRLGLGVYALSPFDRRSPALGTASVDIRLPGSEEIAARVVTPTGSGISDVRVAVKEITVPTSAHSNADPFSDPFTRRRGDPFTNEPHAYRFPSDKIQLVAKTDDDGRVAFQMPERASLVLGIRREGYFPRLHRVSAPGYATGLRGAPVIEESVSPATIELRKQLFVSVAIHDDAGAPVKQYTLSALTPQGKSPSQRFQISEDGRMRTTVEFLRGTSDDNGQVQFIARFPFESGLLPRSYAVPAESVIDRRELRLQAQHGIRASGRVVRKDDGTGIANAQVCWHRQAGRIEDSLLRSTTDAQGEWRMVIPKEKGYLSVVGSSPGLNFLTIDQFNVESSRQRQLTQAIDARDLFEIRVPEFQIQSIPARWVTVVDTNGSPVEGAWVQCQFIETLDRDHRTYHLSQTLAESAKTGPDGRCSLVLRRSAWEHGTVSVMKTDYEDASPRPRFTAAQATINPNSNAPIKLVLRDPWLVSGRVMLDGKPATGLHAGLTTRLIGSGDFGQFKTDTVPIGDDGSFQITAVAGLEYAVAVRNDSDTGRKYFYWQTPIEMNASGRLNVGTLRVSSDQLKTHQQMYDERYKTEIGNTDRG